MQWIKSTQRYTFQPTLPVREVTFLPCYYIIFTIISTHTSREGSDEKPNLKVAFHPIFQPTLPVREVTYNRLPAPEAKNISTHTSREGSDHSKNKCLYTL